MLCCGVFGWAWAGQAPSRAADFDRAYHGFESAHVQTFLPSLLHVTLPALGCVSWRSPTAQRMYVGLAYGFATCVDTRLSPPCRLENWGNIIRDDDIGIKVPLRLEAGIAPDFDSPEVRASRPMTSRRASKLSRHTALCYTQAQRRTQIAHCGTYPRKH